MSSVHASGPVVPPGSCSRPTKVCLDPVRAAAPRICSQIALTPVTWTSQRKYKDRFQFQLSPPSLRCMFVFCFSPREWQRGSITSQVSYLEKKVTELESDSLANSDLKSKLKQENTHLVHRQENTLHKFSHYSRLIYLTVVWILKHVCIVRFI